MNSASRTLKVSMSIGRVTLSEILRDKVLYNIFFVSVLLMGIGFLASQLSGITQNRIVLNFGISGVSISCALLATFIGATLIGKEFERRTVFVALSRPISRLQFVFGKFVGLAAVLFLNWFLMSLVYLLILWQMSGEHFGGLVSGALFWGLVLALVQSFFLAAAAIFVSSFATTSLAAMTTLGVYLIGNNISQIKLLAERAETELAETFLHSLAMLLPDLEHFSLGLKVTYGLPVASSYLLTAFLYGLVLTAVCILAAGLFLQKKEG